MSAHTPGPWHHDKAAGYVFVTTDGGKQDMDVARAFKDADGRLIAAAPDLLAALYEARDQIREFLPTVLGTVLTQVEAAIAKAEGKP